MEIEKVAAETPELIFREAFDPDAGLRGFVDRMTELNKGRAFYTNPQNLGDYVLVDFLDGKRQQARAGRRSA